MLIERQFHALTTGFPGVFIAGATAGTGVHDDLIIRIGAEQRRRQQTIADAGFTAHFVGIVGGRFQAEVQPALIPGAVRQLVNGRRFKSATSGGIDIPRVGDGVF
ncbi:hypothetical protein D3C86_1710510 [compost metagenome]